MQEAIEAIAEIIAEIPVDERASVLTQAHLKVRNKETREDMAAA